MIGNSEIEVNPLRWRLDHKAALLEDDLSPDVPDDERPVPADEDLGEDDEVDLPRGLEDV